MSVDITDLIGIRYKDKGNDKVNGFDCFNYIRAVEERAGHLIPAVRYEGSLVERFKNFTESTLKENKVVLTDNPKMWDVIIFFDSKGRGFHVGVYLENGRFTHCDRKGSHVTELGKFPCGFKRIYTWSE